jgi:hypothetical protein
MMGRLRQGKSWGEAFYHTHQPPFLWQCNSKTTTAHTVSSSRRQ